MTSFSPNRIATAILSENVLGKIVIFSSIVKIVTSARSVGHIHFPKLGANPRDLSTLRKKSSLTTRCPRGNSTAKILDSGSRHHPWVDRNVGHWFWFEIRDGTIYIGQIRVGTRRRVRVLRFDVVGQSTNTEMLAKLPIV
ncbi:hypothetical protein pipiens_010160 [Culex pipiens pipiens]|uniref:F5/8 type C domain-containing protein n=1 Tax=Culex pipiens pipiens TaxID=38569 RepID=A0ABD1DBA3_CULPP